MKERAVTAIEIEETIKNPDKTEPSIKQRINTIKFLNGRFVRVTFKDLSDHLLVITVVVRKRAFQERKSEN